MYEALGINPVAAKDAQQFRQRVKHAWFWIHPDKIGPLLQEAPMATWIAAFQLLGDLCEHFFVEVREELPKGCIRI